MDRIAALIADLAHDDHAARLKAFHTLNDAGVNPIDAARGHTRGKEPRARVNASSVLLVMGIDIGEALDVLTKALKADDPELRTQGAFGLAVVGFVSEDTLAVLIKALGDPKVATREEAAISLARLAWHPDAIKAMPSLVQALQDDAAIVRRHAAYALCLRGASVNGRTFLADLSQWLKDASVDVRQQVLSLLHQQFGGQAIPYLRNALNDRDANIRWIAVFYLGRTGAAARDALKEAAQHADAAVRQQAEQSLKLIDRK